MSSNNNEGSRTQIIVAIISGTAAIIAALIAEFPHSAVN